MPAKKTVRAKKPATKRAQPAKKAVGRPPSYKPEYAEQAVTLCQLGATDFELAEFFKVNTSTIYRWKNTHKEFCEAVMVGKEKADARVERALFNRAVGYTYESEVIRVLRDGTVVRVPNLEHIPPEPGAAFNWLKNRKPQEWRDRQQQEHTVDEPLAALMRDLAGTAIRPVR
jgi:hypothetical protein